MEKTLFLEAIILGFCLQYKRFGILSTLNCSTFMKDAFPLACLCVLSF